MEDITLDELATQVIRGNYGNGKARQQALEKAGYNYHQVQDYVNKRLNGTLQAGDENRNFKNNTRMANAPSAGNTTETIIETETTTTPGQDALNNFMQAFREATGQINHNNQATATADYNRRVDQTEHSRQNLQNTKERFYQMENPALQQPTQQSTNGRSDEDIIMDFLIQGLSSYKGKPYVQAPSTGHRAR